MGTVQVSYTTIHRYTRLVQYIILYIILYLIVHRGKIYVIGYILIFTRTSAGEVFQGFSITCISRTHIPDSTVSQQYF